jgi:DNA repair protein RecO (recombination protein O)
MIVKTSGIIIRTVKYGESSLIFDMYTREYGVCSFIVGGVRKQKAKLSLSLFQLMSWLEVVAYLKSPKDLNRVKEARPLLHYNSMPFDLSKRSVCLFMTEIIQKTIRGHEANEALFDFIKDTFEFVDCTSHPVSNVHVVFLVHFSRFLGFMPIGSWTQAKPFLDMMHGTFVTHAHPLYTLDESTSRQLSACMPCSIENSHELDLSKKVRFKLLEDLIAFYRLHLEKLPEIRTHKILGDVFN